MSHILLKTRSAEQRNQFKAKCAKSGVAMTLALNMFMDAVVDGDVAIKQNVLVRKRKQG